MPSTITTTITTNETTMRRQTQPRKDKRDNHIKTKHQTQTDKRKRNSTQKHQIIAPIMTTESSQRVLANQGACQTTKGANTTYLRKGRQKNLIKHAIKRVCNIAYLIIHVDAGALAFTRCKNLPPRHLSRLPPRHFGKTSQNTQHNIVR